jgi:ATP-dependent DNA helicase RecG
MLPREKERAMRAFKDRQADILVSTSVIEVGIDVPNATIIIIEGAERFGLAQLHQFRGRVGRGEHLSHCFLFTTTPEQARSPRLRAMEEHESGFILAEIDLKLRGPGELFGTRQSGYAISAFQQFFQPEFVVRARRAAERTLAQRASPLGESAATLRSK